MPHFLPIVWYAGNGNGYKPGLSQVYGGLQPPDTCIHKLGMQMGPETGLTPFRSRLIKSQYGQCNATLSNTTLVCFSGRLYDPTSGHQSEIDSAAGPAARSPISPISDRIINRLKIKSEY